MILAGHLFVRAVDDVKQVVTVVAALPASHIAQSVQEFDGGGQPGLEVATPLLIGQGSLASDTFADALHHLIHFGRRETRTQLVEHQAGQMIIPFGEERVGLFSQRVDVLRTAGRLAATHEGGCDEPLSPQDVKVVTHGDGRQVQFPAQFVNRRLIAFLQNTQNALSGGLHRPTSSAKYLSTVCTF